MLTEMVKKTVVSVILAKNSQKPAHFWLKAIKMAKTGIIDHSKGPGWEVGPCFVCQEGDTGPKNVIFRVEIVIYSTNFWSGDLEVSILGDTVPQTRDF